MNNIFTGSSLRCKHPSPVTFATVSSLCEPGKRVRRPASSPPPTGRRSGERYPDRVRTIELASHPTDTERSDVAAFADRLEREIGSPVLSDHLRLDLARSEHDGAGPLLATIRDAGEIVAVAQVSAANEAALLEVVVEPALADAITIRDDIVESIVGAHRRASDHPLVWWLDDPSDHDREVAARFGLVIWRQLFEMRRTLPHPEHAEIATRPYRPGQDDEAWLRVNNRAFADHGEQGGWTLDTLALRLREPWFDPEGFRVYESDGEMVAFCWTKLHTDTDPVVGEIYVIAVDPSAHGRGLGRQLTLAGLDSISSRDVTVANLYVDAGNTAAVTLYERLGFHVHRRRIAFAPDEVTSR